MIAIISGTNRMDSNTHKIATICKNIVESENSNAQLIDLKSMSGVSLDSTMYVPDNQDAVVAKTQDEILLPSNKWIIIIPEYNGGIPGIFKLFIDILSTRLKDETFQNKTALIIGVAAGRAGNARGLDYLTNCLNYLGMNVYPSKLPISSIGLVLENDTLDEGTMDILSSTIQRFIKS